MKADHITQVLRIAFALQWMSQQEDNEGKSVVLEQLGVELQNVAEKIEKELERAFSRVPDSKKSFAQPEK